MVAQISRRIPVLKKLLDGEAVAATEAKDASSDSAAPCPPGSPHPFALSSSPLELPSRLSPSAATPWTS